MVKKEVNFGFVGISGRGSGMLREFLSIDGVKVTAVCDKYEDRAENGRKIVMEETGEEPAVYLDYKELLKRDDIAGIVCCTTWITHSRIAIDAMKAGKHVAFEVGGAASIEECWELVRTAESTGKICMMLENCCYDRNEMAIFNMVKQGLFGEIVHLEGGYRHELSDEICHGKENRHGRLMNFIHRNGDLYPTHQLGPICKLIGINRGNRLLTISSIASKAVGLNSWLEKNHDKDYYLQDQRFNCGDIVTSIIKCANGETITLNHDCSLPRPYFRDYCVQGTKGIYKEGKEDGEDWIYVHDVTPEDHRWHYFAEYREKYDHPLWKAYADEGIHFGGHGGMDYLVLSAYAEAAMNDLPSPIDVYDTATWMAITVLSEQSVALGGMPMPIPDFTNGNWIEREETRRGMYCLDEVCYEAFENLEADEDEK